MRWKGNHKHTVKIWMAMVVADLEFVCLFIKSTIIFSQSHEFFIVKTHSRRRHVSALSSHHQALS